MTLPMIVLALALWGQAPHPKETWQQLEVRIAKANPTWSSDRVASEGNSVAELCYHGDHKEEAARAAEITTPVAQCTGKTKAGTQCKRKVRGTKCYQHKGGSN